jgi:Zn-dependent protease with chaperone function
MRRILDASLGVAALAAGACLITLLPEHCPRSVACMGSAASMNAPTIAGRVMEAAGVAVAVAVLARTLWILRTTRRACSTLMTVTMPLALASALARTGIRRVRCVERAPLAVFCHGVVYPTVVIEAATLRSLSGQALDAVLLHEDAHRRHHDPLRRALRRAMVDVGCGSRLLSWWSSRAAVREELRADAWAVQHVGRPALARALIALASPGAPTSMPAFGDAAGARVTQLLGGRVRLPGPPASSLTRAAVAAAGLVAMTICAAMSSI